MEKFRENKRQPKRQRNTVTIGNVKTVPPGRSATVKLKSGGELPLFNVGGRFYAIENFCPHKAAPLADSRFYGNEVECDAHGWCFDVRTGECLTKKDYSIEACEVLVEDETIKVIV